MTRIVIVGFDGLQMWQIEPEFMPNLAAFADDGVRFERHHPVVPSVTRLNAASLVTGCVPGTHGIAGNRMVFRDVDGGVVTDVLEPALRKIDTETGGRVLLVPTLADRLAGHGLEYVAVISGTSGNAYCHAPNAARTAGATIHPDFCLPDDLYSEIEDRFGIWPEESVPNVARLRFATDVFLDYAVAERTSDVVLIWYSEPDKSQHGSGVGSETALEALRAADAEFGKLLKSIPEDVDVFVVSDHGYSTVASNIDINAELRGAGFPPLEQSGGVSGAPNGGTALLYMNHPENALASRIAEWLMGRDWCGTLLSAERVGEIAGTLPMSLVGMDGPRGPDLAVSTRWELTEGGDVATAPSFGDLPTPQGDHGGVSKTEMRNALVARGPHLSRGIESQLPSGNTDLLPTIMHLLDLPIDRDVDGRVLWEALSDGGSVPPEITRTHEASLRNYAQYVQVSTVADVDYIDEGNRR